MADIFQLPNRFVVDEQARRNFLAIESFFNHSDGLQSVIINKPFDGPPVDVTGLSGTINFDNLRLHWNPEIDKPYLTYEVWESDTTDFAEPEVGNLVYVTSGNVANIVKAASATGYYYHVRARNTAGDYGAHAECGPFVFTSPEAVPDGPPEDVISRREGVAFRTLMLNWEFNYLKDYLHWEVHEGTTSGFTPNTDNLILTVNAPMCVITHDPGGPYYYKICSVNKAGDKGSYTTFGPFTYTKVPGTDIADVPLQLIRDKVGFVLADGTIDLASIRAKVPCISATGQLNIAAVTAEMLADGAVNLGSSAVVGHLAANRLSAGVLGADVAYIGTLGATHITAGTFGADVAYIGSVGTNQLVARGALIDSAMIGSLGVGKLIAEGAQINVALIPDLTANKIVTGTLSSVTVTACTLNSNTLNSSNIYSSQIFSSDFTAGATAGYKVVLSHSAVWGTYSCPGVKWWNGATPLAWMNVGDWGGAGTALRIESADQLSINATTAVYLSRNGSPFLTVTGASGAYSNLNLPNGSVLLDRPDYFGISHGTKISVASPSVEFFADVTVGNSANNKTLVVNGPLRSIGKFKAEALTANSGLFANNGTTGGEFRIWMEGTALYLRYNGVSYAITKTAI